MYRRLPSPLRVLVIDDSTDFCSLSLASLHGASRWRIDGVAVQTVDDALAHLQDNEVHLVLLDYDLGSTTAVQVIQTFRERDFDLPVVPISSNWTPELDLELRNAGAAAAMLMKSGLMAPDYLAVTVVDVATNWFNERSDPNSTGQLATREQAQVINKKIGRNPNKPEQSLHERMEEFEKVLKKSLESWHVQLVKSAVELIETKPVLVLVFVLGTVAVVSVIVAILILVPESRTWLAK